ncbi:hypothetical protein HY634_02105 [Candidatus Uhrbacteria bacterium]|nr:hypothetical protein [Candidatus Uhrbacteria bacterium]
MSDDTKATGPKDVCIQLLLIAALYMSATQLGVLLFQLINVYVPDTALELSHRTASVSAIRWAIAMLIVTAPVFFGVTWSLRRTFERAPEKLQLRSRRWLTALTLFAAALITIGDLVAVISWFLQGELTARFLLKALVVFVIAGAVMWYERWEFRRTLGGHPPTSILALRWGSAFVVLAAIVAGFMVIGSPFTARRDRLDAQRASDLQNIQAQVVDHWQRTRTLPASLDALTDTISGYAAPRDPETAQPYEFRILTDLRFELCATFRTDVTTRTGRTPKPVRPYRGQYDTSLENWTHGAARTCFERTISPARYPPRPFVDEPPAPGLKPVAQ